ncbi:MAG TPA: cupredoxin family copper-binding protein [Stellaceae bacterium]|jgi:plastocyanin|nr:cupredoxin family copper-binding protein [Stellaceae bacterium]
MKFISIRRALPLAAAVTLALSQAAYAADTNPPQQVAAAEAGAVTISNFAFAPALVTVAPGTKITWVNNDEEPHTVTSADGGKTFKSEALDTGDKFTFTFDKPGTYKYFCSIHPHMVATIVVK